MGVPSAVRRCTKLPIFLPKQQQQQQQQQQQVVEVCEACASELLGQVYTLFTRISSTPATTPKATMLP
jgi:DNA-binding transcriptional regulator YbjK